MNSKHNSDKYILFIEHRIKATNRLFIMNTLYRTVKNISILTLFIPHISFPLKLSIKTNASIVNRIKTILFLSQVHKR
jgi:hypothetical protein